VPPADPSLQSRALDRFAHRWRAPETAFRGRVCVLSPHLDDAALSLGASLARAAKAGADVRVITVFAGRPDSTFPASVWDASAGFASLGEATRARRREDAEAGRLLGVTPVWLSFADNFYDEGATDDDVWAAVSPTLDGADLVLAPGFPLIHHDHLRLARLVRARLPARLVAYYVEQPYAAWLRSGFSDKRPAADEVSRLQSAWCRLRAAPWSWVTKVKAMRAYPSQLRLMYQPTNAILAYELRRGGETVALPPPWASSG
jgi:LmbE family N-acetylglucosaminyl deacetylase